MINERFKKKKMSKGGILFFKKAKKGLRKLTIGMLVFLFVFFVAPKISLATDDPYYNRARGEVESNIHIEADQISGSFVYDYPIVVPPGRNGMQPNLSLAYNNQSTESNGVFGQGWNLNIPYIERINREGSEDLYSKNYFNSSMSGELKFQQNISSSTNTVFPNPYSASLSSANNQYLSISDTSQTGLDLSGDFSLEAWVRLESLPGLNVSSNIISKYKQAGNNRSYQVFYYVDGDGNDFLGFYVSTNGSAVSTWLSPITAFSLDTWYHLAFTLDASEATAKIYINNSLFDTKTDHAPSVYNSSAPLEIGAGGDGPTSFFDGKIDEIRVWGDVRTAQEISDNYQKQLTGSESGLVGYWRLNGDSGDLTSNNNDLLNNNSASFNSDVPFTANPVPIFNDQYGAKIDNGDFIKYNNINNQYWLATDKNGTVYKYGSSTSSRVDNPDNLNKVFKWMLEEVRDKNGNYVKYEYYKNNGQIYPYKITYTGHDTTDGEYEIEFLREARNDNVSHNYPGFKVKTNYRISEIQVKINGSWVKKYELDYVAGDNGIKSVLDAITKSGKDEDNNVVVLPSDNFDYQTKVGTWSQNTGYSIPEDFVYFDQCDFGVRLADVNGDGLIDMIKAQSGQTRKVYINNGNGTGWSYNSSYVVPLDFVDGVCNDYGVRLVDVNGDGLVDMIWADYSNREVYINNGNGTGWAQDTNYNFPAGVIGANGLDNGARMIDVNGDGLVDIVHAEEGYARKVFINDGDGTGWTENSNYSFPVDIVYSRYDYNRPRGVLLADVNGDGLIDVLHSEVNASGTSKEVYINKGDGMGWEQNTNYNIPVIFGNYGSDTYAQLMDVNGDGLADIVTNSQTTYINRGDGTGWTQNTNYTIPLGFSSGATRVADVNGDGLDDILYSTVVFNSNGSNYSDRRVYIANGKKADSLTQVTHSKGAITKVNYKGSAESYNNGVLNQKLPYVLQVVDKLVVNDGLGNIATSTFEYYGGAYYYGDEYDRRLAGFNKVEKVDSEGNKTKTFYHQGNETSSSYGEFADDQSKIGRIYRTEVYDASDNLYSKTINKWVNVGLGNDRDFVKLAQSVSSDYDGDTTHRDKASSYVYDDTNGNLQQIINYGEVTGNDSGTFADTGADLASTTIEYAASTTLDIIGLPKNKLTVDQNSNKVSEAKYYYDNLSYGNVSIGNQTKEENWKSGNSYIGTTKTYNTYGLVTQENDPRGKTTTFTYDAYNLYPSSITNAKNQTTNYLYDYSCGKAKKITDPNSSIRETVYDGLDRIVTEKQSDIDTPSTEVVKAAYVYNNTSLPRSIVKTNYLDGALTNEQVTYLNGLGQNIQDRQQSEDVNTFAVKDYLYNKNGLLKSESLPYFSSGDTYSNATSIASLLTNYSYDALGRILKINNSVGTTTTVYDDWKTTVTDTNGQVKDLYKDAYNNLVRVDEHNDTNIYSTYYIYDLQGKLKKITDANGNIRNFTYDGLNRLVSSEDLHVSTDSTFGVISFTYDDAGNILSKVDPNNNTVNYTYDDLNRNLTEDNTGSGGTEMTNVYDNCTNGVGYLCSASTTSVTSAFTYNSLGRIKTETKTVNNNPYVTTYDYDRQGNLVNISYPDNSQVQYVYNNGGQIETIQQKENGSYSDIVSDYDYNPMGQIIYELLGNNISTQYVYDANDLYRLKQKKTTANNSMQSAFFEVPSYQMLLSWVEQAIRSDEETLQISAEKNESDKEEVSVEDTEAIKILPTEENPQEVVEADKDKEKEVLAENIEEVPALLEESSIKLDEEIMQTVVDENNGKKEGKQNDNTEKLSVSSKYDKSQIIKNKYALEKGALIKKAKGINDIEVRIGERNKDDFVPELNIRKWDQEVNFKIKPKDSENEGKNMDLGFEDKVIKFKGEKKEYHFYDIDKNDDHSEGAYEFVVIFNEKPDSNEVKFDIETDNLVFYYQPYLEDMLQAGQKIVGTEIVDQDGNLVMGAREDVLGSYAAYHKDKKGDYSQVGGKNYKTGKAFHIFRPKIKDAVGNWVWGEFNRDLNETHELIITVPQEFLDKAVYPITVDPTFGYTAEGYDYDLPDDSIRGNLFSPGYSGYVTKMNAFVSMPGNDRTKTAIYNNDLSLLGYSDEISGYLPTYEWKQYLFNTSPRVLSISSYYLLFWGNTVQGYNTRIRFDQGATYYSKGQTYGDWSDSIILNTGVDSRIYSMYATYTVPTNPTVTTGIAERISSGTEKLYGDMNIGEYEDVDLFFNYGLTESLSATTTPISQTTSTPFYQNVFNLNDLDLYNYRIGATDNVDYWYGNTEKFFAGDVATTTYKSTQWNASGNSSAVIANNNKLQLNNASSGYWISLPLDLDLISNVSDSKIKWSALTPANTSVSVYTGINSSATTPPSSWDEAISGSAISNASGDLSGKYLWTKIVLTSNIATSTPEISWLAYGINESGASSLTTLQDLYYTYDNIGNITKIIDLSDTKNNKVLDFGYDYLNRLTSASTTEAVVAGFSQTYAYDPIGNITNKSDIGNYTYSNTSYANPHAVTQVASSVYSYDNNGNLTNDGTWTHAWTYDNRLASSTNGSINLSYGYDHTGQRVKMTNGTDSYVYPNKYFNINNATTTKHIFANDQLIATIESSGIATSTYYTHADHLGGSSVITDDNGLLAQTLDYYPFGDVRVNEKEGSFNEKRKFTGHEYDEDTNLNYMVARYQSGNVGRFISVDPIFNKIGDKVAIKAIINRSQSSLLTDPQQLNAYSYARNNPIIFIDPLGLWTDDGGGNFTAEKGDTLSGLQQETGRSWQDAGFNRDPKTLQIGETVSFNKSSIYAGPTIDSTDKATEYYFIGPGGNVNLGANAQSTLNNSSEQKYHEGRIVSGATPLDEGDYGVDLTDEQYYIGRTNVNYYTTKGTKYGVTTFTGFVRDGFWDVVPGRGDGLGPQNEIPFGTPYSFNPYSWTISYPVP